MTAFTGFPVEAWDFLDGLATDNTSAYFDDHREQYRRTIAIPAAAFVEAVTPALQESVHPGLRGEARVGRSLFRINRDTRFGHDKTPYKTQVDFLFWIGNGEPRQSPACIMRLTTTSVLVGAGQIGLTGPGLVRYRSHVAGDEGASLRSIVDRLLADRCELSEANRVRVPAPHPNDHPNADLLRRDGFHMSHTIGHPDALGDERFVSWTATELSRYGSLLDWLSARQIQLGRFNPPETRGSF